MKHNIVWNADSDFAGFMRLSRERRGKTQRQAAKALGVSQAYIGKLEHEPRKSPVNMAFLTRVADAYEMPLDAVLIGAGFQPPRWTRGAKLAQRGPFPFRSVRCPFRVVVVSPEDQEVLGQHKTLEAAHDRARRWYWQVGRTLDGQRRYTDVQFFDHVRETWCSLVRLTPTKKRAARRGSHQ